MPDCVADLIAVTERKLALVIVTHYHADHLSGFATQYDEFAQFEVGAVWITNRLDPGDASGDEVQGAAIDSLATHLRLQLQLRLAAARTSPPCRPSRRSRTRSASVRCRRLRNDKGPGSRHERIQQLIRRFITTRRATQPALPAVLQGALTAEILGPSPKDVRPAISRRATTRRSSISRRLSSRGLPDTEQLGPFDRRLAGQRERLSRRSVSSVAGIPGHGKGVACRAARRARGRGRCSSTARLNNQSLVVLFTCRGKKLLFVGDAQWGNWAYWLYGRAREGQGPGHLRERARDPGRASTSTRWDTTAAPTQRRFRQSARCPRTCVAMCSTETGYPSAKRTYGKSSRRRPRFRGLP